MALKELTITELAYRLKFLNDDFKKIHEDWDETQKEKKI